MPATRSDLGRGRSLGLQSMEQALAGLARAGVIVVEEARNRANRPDELDRMLGSAL